MKNHKKYSLPPLSGYISYILALIWLFLVDVPGCYSLKEAEELSEDE